MTINGLIKSTKDKALVAKFLNDPVRTCNELGVAVDISLLDNVDMPFFTDITFMQGGYRP